MSNDRKRFSTLRTAFFVAQGTTWNPDSGYPVPFSVSQIDAFETTSAGVVQAYDSRGDARFFDWNVDAFETEAPAVRRAVELNRELAQRFEHAATLGEQRLNELVEDVNRPGVYPTIRAGQYVILLPTIRRCQTLDYHTYQPSAVGARGRVEYVDPTADVDEHGYLVRFEQARWSGGYRRMELSLDADQTTPVPQTGRLEEIRLGDEVRIWSGIETCGTLRYHSGLNGLDRSRIIHVSVIKPAPHGPQTQETRHRYGVLLYANNQDRHYWFTREELEIVGSIRPGTTP